MDKRNILIVVVDGLRAGALGAYGNTTFGTPALDRFAADSFLLDSCFAPTADLEVVYGALWQSRYPLRPITDDQRKSLPKLLAENGWETILLTDDGRLAAFKGASGFEHQLVVNAADDAGAKETRAPDMSKTAIAELFTAIYHVIDAEGFADVQHKSSAGNRPRLIWVHSRGMYGPWDAPLDLQMQLLDEGDPPPVEAVTPPDLSLTQSDDPDMVFRYSCAYAAQTIVLDSCWNALIEMVDAVSGRGEWLVALLGARGFPLGEHHRIGGLDERIYGEQLHVPWLMRFPNGAGRLARSRALASHYDVLPTILDWTKIKRPRDSAGMDGNTILPLAANPRAAWRDAAIATSPESRTVRTRDWCLRQDIEPNGPNPSVIASELYVRPDDRWEANDVAKLCSDDVESLTHLADDLTRQLSEHPRTAQ